MKSVDRRIKEFKLRRAERLQQRADSARYDYDRPTDDYDWITIKGQHTPIDDGNIVGGVGGKFKGKKYTGSKMTQSKKRLAKLAEKAKSAANGVRKVALKATKAAQRIAGAKGIGDIKTIFNEEFGIESGKLQTDDWYINGLSSDIDDTWTTDHIRSGYVGMSDSFTEFPELKGFVSHITGLNSGVACFGSVYRYIGFNPNYFKNEEKLEKVLADCSEVGWWPKNATPASVMAHECGHALQYMIAEKYGKKAPVYCQSLVRRAITNVQKTGYGKGKSASEMRQGISRQAADRNTKETVAEAFADCYSNGENANPLSIEIRRLVVNDYNRFFGKN